MDKEYYIIAMFALLALCFPVMYDEALDANLTNTGLDLLVTNFPVVILVIFIAVVIMLLVDRKQRRRG